MDAVSLYRRVARSRAGFTLLELMLVMTLMAVMTAMVTPLFRGSIDSMRAENAIRDLVATMEYAQARSIVEVKEYRLYLAPDQNAYWLSKGESDDGEEGTFERVSDTLSMGAVLPKTLRMASPSARKDDQTPRYYIAFYPNGLCDTSSIPISLTQEESLYLVSTTGTRVQWQKGRS